MLENSQHAAAGAGSVGIYDDAGDFDGPPIVGGVALAVLVLGLIGAGFTAGILISSLASFLIDQLAGHPLLDQIAPTAAQARAGWMHLVEGL
ncbi:hypothetical protein [Paracoccus yeei]|uniref:hypothetical protein n=1 Tax=Paracoccus yeei TaxID=147645 RepID=UPI003BF7A920